VCFVLLIFFQYHKIINSFKLEGTIKGHLVQLLSVNKDIYSWITLLKAQIRLTLNVSKDGVSTTSISNLLQCLTNLIIKNIFLIFKLNLTSCSLKTFPLALSQKDPAKVRLYPSFLYDPFTF